MRDRDIRAALRQEIASIYRYDVDTIVIDELGVCEGEARIDIAVVNGSLAGYEIKSDVDTLQRLPHQVSLYSKLLDEVTVVSSASHLAKAKTIIPEWWGLSEAFIQDGALRFALVRKAKRNTTIDPYSLVQLLWRNEALALLKQFGHHKGLTSKPRKEIWTRLAQVKPIDDLRECVRDALRSRQNWRVVQPPRLNGG
jgi:hypothetical protein